MIKYRIISLLARTSDAVNGRSLVLFMFKTVKLNLINNYSIFGFTTILPYLATVQLVHSSPTPLRLLTSIIKKHY